MTGPVGGLQERGLRLGAGEVAYLFTASKKSLPLLWSLPSIVSGTLHPGQGCASKRVSMHEHVGQCVSGV